MRGDGSDSVGPYFSLSLLSVELRVSRLLQSLLLRLLLPPSRVDANLSRQVHYIRHL